MREEDRRRCFDQAARKARIAQRVNIDDIRRALPQSPQDLRDADFRCEPTPACCRQPRKCCRRIRFEYQRQLVIFVRKGGNHSGKITLDSPDKTPESVTYSNSHLMQSKTWVIGRGRFRSTSMRLLYDAVRNGLHRVPWQHVLAAILFHRSQSSG